MNIIEYIDAYFQKTLGEEEQKNFERRCEEDKTFAQEVAFFITAKQTLREELLQQKQTLWQNKNAEDEMLILPLIKKSFTSRWFMYAAAACLVLALSVYLFETNISPKKYATNYINNTYGNISQAMDASHDSLQLGIAAYNNEDYNTALRLFIGLEKNDSLNSEAKKNAGLSYLKNQDYDNAIQQFDDLSQMKLFSNAGDFLKAISLLERNKEGDKETARKLLQKVVDEKEEGIEKAQEWLTRF